MTVDAKHDVLLVCAEKLERLRALREEKVR